MKKQDNKLMSGKLSFLIFLWVLDKIAMLILFVWFD